MSWSRKDREGCLWVVVRENQKDLLLWITMKNIFVFLCLSINIILPTVRLTSLYQALSMLKPVTKFELLLLNMLLGTAPLYFPGGPRAPISLAGFEHQSLVQAFRVRVMGPSCICRSRGSQKLPPRCLWSYEQLPNFMGILSFTLLHGLMQCSSATPQGWHSSVSHVPDSGGRKCQPGGAQCEKLDSQTLQQPREVRFSASLVWRVVDG